MGDWSLYWNVVYRNHCIAKAVQCKIKQIYFSDENLWYVLYICGLRKTCGERKVFIWMIWELSLWWYNISYCVYCWLGDFFKSKTIEIYHQFSNIFSGKGRVLVIVHVYIYYVNAQLVSNYQRFLGWQKAFTMEKGIAKWVVGF